MDKSFKRGLKWTRELKYQWLFVGVVLVVFAVVFLILKKNPLDSVDLAKLLAGHVPTAAQGSPGFTKGLETVFMAILWLLLAVVLAAPYMIYSVRRRVFYPDEAACREVERAIVAVSQANPEDLNARYWAYKAKLGGELSHIRRGDHHLAEVVNQISHVVLSSNHTLDRYFMTQAKDIKEEEYQKLNLVNLASNLGPVIGFAGTILGMILAFSQLGQEMSKEMIGQIAGAIYVALITTLFGLMIKAVAAVMRYLIQHWTDKHVTRILTISSNITSLQVDTESQ